MPAEHLVVDGHRLEVAWHGPRPDEAPTLVLLHEGLGSLSQWRDFPSLLAAATGCGAFAYSRLGYGASDPAPLPRPVRYMHDEALVTLPRVIDAAGLRDFVLVGHSDGASIAILYAGSPLADARLRGLVLEAPHVFVEDMTVARIAALGEEYRGSLAMRRRFALHHGARTDETFWGWHRVWLDPEFRRWNIEASLPSLRVPTLVLQGREDEFGSEAQPDAIARQSGGPVEVRLLDRCRHAPHRDQPEATLAALTDFVRRVIRK